MRQMEAQSFGNDYEYKNAKRNERKADRQRRDARRGGKRVAWQTAE